MLLMAFKTGRGKLAIGILSLAVLALVIGAWSVHTTGSLTGLFTGSAPSSSMQTVKVGYIPVTQALPIFVALQQGLYEKHGIHVQTVRFDAPNQLMDALASGQVSYSAYSAATGIAAIVQDKQPGTILYAGFACNDKNVHTNNALLVRADSKIASLKDLEGKKIGRLPGIQWKTLTTALLARNGVNASKVEQVELAVPLQAQALQTGAVDALLSLEPVPTIAVSKGIAKVLILEPMANLVLEPFCPGASVLNAKFAREHPELAKAVVDASDEAAAIIERDPSTKQALTNYTGLDSATAAKVPMNYFVSIHDATPAELDAVQRFVDLFHDANVTKTRVQVRGMLASVPS